MAIQGPFKVECGEVFPHGVGVVGAVTALVDFDKSTKETKVQQLDKDSGQLVWEVDVMDFDPEARDRTFKVKIVAPVQPVPPEAIPGAPVRPVLLEALTVTPYLRDVGNGRQKIAYSLRASGLAARGRPAARVIRPGRPEVPPEVSGRAPMTTVRLYSSAGFGVAVLSGMSDCVYLDLGAGVSLAVSRPAVLEALADLVAAARDTWPTTASPASGATVPAVV